MFVGKGLVCWSLPNALPLSLLDSLPLSFPLSCPLSLPVAPPKFLSYFVSHYFLALYCQYSHIISGQLLDSTNSRGAPPSCTICRSWAQRPPCPPGTRPGREARQGRRVNTGGILNQHFFGNIRLSWCFIKYFWKRVAYILNVSTITTSGCVIFFDWLKFGSSNIQCFVIKKISSSHFYTLLCKNSSKWREKVIFES